MNEIKRKKEDSCKAKTFRKSIFRNGSSNIFRFALFDNSIFFNAFFFFPTHKKRVPLSNEDEWGWEDNAKKDYELGAKTKIMTSSEDNNHDLNSVLASHSVDGSIHQISIASDITTPTTNVTGSNSNVHSSSVHNSNHSSRSSSRRSSLNRDVDHNNNNSRSGVIKQTNSYTGRAIESSVSVSIPKSKSNTGEKFAIVLK